MTTSPERTPSALGRGLSALIPQRAGSSASVIEIPLSRVAPNPHQPRHHMDEDGLEELAASIREHGVLQPVLVTEGERDRTTYPFYGCDRTALFQAEYRGELSFDLDLSPDGESRDPR